MRAGSNPVDRLHFAVKKNFTHLLPATVQKKIERLYQVILTFKEKDVVGQWIQLEGEPVDQRNAMVILRMFQGMQLYNSFILFQLD